MERGFEIKKVNPGSPADRAGIKPGERLIKINGSFFYDILDYFYHSADEILTLSLQEDTGATRELRLRKKYDEDPGIEFSSPTIGPLLRCRNRCVFCFIDQQPTGLRPSLYEKDDDYRLSFFHGNYITLSNLGRKDLLRIIRRKVSPLYVSIHSTDPLVRSRIMRNRAAGHVWKQLKALAEAGIEIHGQVVVCPGYNDGEILKNTVKDLSLLYPSLKTLALVPVGITGHRCGLPELTPVSRLDAKGIVDYFSSFQESMQEKTGAPFVYLADEFYILSGTELPPHEHYGAYEQLENGVGLSRLFLNELEEWEEKGRPRSTTLQELTIATGFSAEFLLRRLAERLKGIPGLHVNVYALPNSFWGGNVSVSGLFTGSDLIDGLQERKLGQKVLVTRDMLKEDSNLFLDDFTLQEVSRAIGAEVVPVGSLFELNDLLAGKMQPANK